MSRGLEPDTVEAVPDQEDARALLDDAYERLMALCETTFDAGSHEAAYHCLEAALHVADKLGDPERIDRIEAIAESQEKCIDALPDCHPLSSSAATRRQTHSVYHSLRLRSSAVKTHLRYPAGNASV